MKTKSRRRLHTFRSAMSIQMSYCRAGVDIEGADRWLSSMQRQIRSTHDGRVLKGLRSFAGLYRVPAQFKDPVLVASADGVGTKLALARNSQDYETIGEDVVAMNVNDIVVFGAHPLFFLDYLAVGKLKVNRLSALLRGIVRGCRKSNCALLGGETAEMPGVYRRNEYDIAGFSVGIAERSRIIDGSSLRAGDIVIGLASSGVHANGFSLIRRALPAKALKRLIGKLMVPTNIYVQPLLRLSRQVEIHSISHITGGGIARRLPQLVAAKSSLQVRLITGSWRIAPVFTAIQRAGNLSDREMASTFNMGIGMAIACRPSDGERAIRLMRKAGITAWLIGLIESRRS